MSDKTNLFPRGSLVGEQNLLVVLVVFLGLSYSYDYIFKPITKLPLSL